MDFQVYETIVSRIKYMSVDVLNSRNVEYRRKPICLNVIRFSYVVSKEYLPIISAVVAVLRTVSQPRRQRIPSLLHRSSKQTFVGSTEYVSSQRSSVGDWTQRERGNIIWSAAEVARVSQRRSNEPNIWTATLVRKVIGSPSILGDRAHAADQYSNGPGPRTLPVVGTRIRNYKMPSHRRGSYRVFTYRYRYRIRFLPFIPAERTSERPRNGPWGGW